jgi:LAS superfamily LD-carboxypeptidase LdcB
LAEKVSLQGYANGHIPASALCTLSFDPSASLRCDAAHAIEALDAAYVQAFGTHLTVNDSYRSYTAQLICLRARGYLCAEPGTSHHGLGIAVDLGGGIQTYGSSAHDWLVKNGPQFGWTEPAWALPGGSRPEAWHWEYVA